MNQSGMLKYKISEKSELQGVLKILLQKLASLKKCAFCRCNLISFQVNLNGLK
jgi:hypothetical protein